VAFLIRAGILILKHERHEGHEKREKSNAKAQRTPGDAKKANHERTKNQKRKLAD
jgi:hypothetical protein